MQRADFKVVLDACVLANARVCNVLLTLAESPRLYLPRWSDKILEETRRTHIDKLGWEARLADSFQSNLREYFPEALIAGYDHLVDHCENDPKDRHVLAAAIHSKSELILTFNLKDFPSKALKAWQVEVLHPQDYLLAIYSMDPSIVIHRLNGICQNQKTDLESFLLYLGKWLPAFSQALLNDIGSST